MSQGITFNQRTIANVAHLISIIKITLKVKCPISLKKKSSRDIMLVIVICKSDEILMKSKGATHSDMVN